MREFVYWTRENGEYVYAGIGSNGCIQGGFGPDNGFIIKEPYRSNERSSLLGSPRGRQNILVMIQQPKP